jgi:ADP-ribosylation factor-binding protein GGA
MSLIDFDDSLNAANAASSPGGGINDLANLFSAPAPQVQQPSFTLAGNLGPTNTSRPTPSTITHSPTPVSYNRNGGPLFSAVSSPPIQTATPPASIMLPPTPQQQQLQNTTSMPNYFNGLNPAKGPIQYSAMGAMAPQRQAPQPSQSSNPSNQSQGKDPFADLAGLF